MLYHHPVLDHCIVHRDFHISRVRIVREAEVDEAVSSMRFLVPHEIVMTTPMGCSHRCVYTNEAPASMVEERICGHMLEVRHEIV
jgi:hypothetical protein